MKKIFVKRLNQLFELTESVFQIIIEDPEIYRELAFAIEENIIYSINGKEINLLKYLLKIDNCFVLDINDKRLLSSLYKRIINRITDEQKRKIMNIENLFIELFDEISDFSEDKLVYKSELDLQKIFNLFQLCFQEYEKTNYLEYLLSYIKVSVDTNGTLIVVLFNLLNMLKDSELHELKKELSLIDVVLIDLTFSNNVRKINHVIIDNDWCII